MQIQFMQKNTKEWIVVICFKFSNFAYANTVEVILLAKFLSCYLL